MSGAIDKAGLKVAASLADFIDNQALPGTGLEPAAFWAGVARIFTDFAPVNRELLAKRDRIQAAIDAWHRGRQGQPIDQREYQAFLRQERYLVDEPAPFQITSADV